MNNKKVILCMKVVAAGIVAFVILNLICMLYYNVPIHSSSKSKSTDYLWPKNKFYSRGTEGFAWGITDKNGFNNLETFEKGEIDVLFMGSSHMEGFNVAQDKNTVALLNNKFQTSGIDMNAYNIGISGHTLLRCLNNLENAINEFEPRKYIIIETQSIEPSNDDIISVLEGDLAPLESQNSGIVGLLQKSPYLRLLYTQLKNGADNDILEKGSEHQDKNKIKTEKHELLNVLLNKSSKICNEAGIQLIIFYNSSIDIDDQGKINKQEKIDSIEAFKKICDNNGIIFVDMYDSFKNNYDKTYKLPRGFSNSKIGTGHLNEEGHRVIADTLFSVICK